MAKALTTKRLKIMKAGLVFMLLTAFSVFAAINVGENLLYIVVGGLFSMVAVSWVFPLWLLGRARIVREAPYAVDRDDPFAVAVRVENRSRGVPMMSVRIECDDDASDAYYYAMKIPAGSAARFRVSHRFDKRGVHRLPPVCLTSSFPFGLVEASVFVWDHTEVVVYPRVCSVHASVLQRLKGRGHTRKTLSGDGDEFFGLRDYVRGDDLRRVAWRASARREGLLVKEMEVDTSRAVTLIFDSVSEAWTGDFEERFEEAVELVASLAVTLLNRRYRVALLTPEIFLQLDEGQSHVLRILDALARVVALPMTDADRLARHAEYVNNTRSATLVVSPHDSVWERVRGFAGARRVLPRELIRG